MTTLVTGASGFLGRAVVAALARVGCADLRCQARLLGRSVELARTVEASGLPAASMVEGNLLSRADCARLCEGVSTIVHVAAGTRGAAADMMLNTVVATRNLLEAAPALRRLVLVSSFAVYDTARLARGAMLDESSPLEDDGVAKGAYAMSKLWQERLAAAHCAARGIELVVLRPGVIYGPGGPPMSSRVGIRALGWFFSLGRGCLLPLTHVDNCADAIAAATARAPGGGVYNVVDDHLPTCSDYLRRYRALVEPLRVVPVPYPLLALGARVLASYSRRSRGQLPPLLGPHVVRSMYRRLRYSNAALKRLGWSPGVDPRDGVDAFLRGLAAARRGGSAG